MNVCSLGDTRIKEESDPAKPLEKFSEAKRLFAKIPQLYATNQAASPLVPLAWGRIGDCSLQLAGADAKQYENATNAYWLVITNGLADITVRSLAEFGLGQTLEAQATNVASPESAALRTAAFDHYYNIALGVNAGNGEEPDPFWIREAGFAAARVKEEQREWTVALNIYKRMQDALPPLRPRLQEKIDKARAQAQREKN